MDWLKEVILDIMVTIFILAAVYLADPWMAWIIWIYTGVMLLTKSLILFGDSFLRLADKAKTSAPVWFTHLLYGVNTAALFIFQWWFAATGWALIWIFSYMAQRKLAARRGQ